MTTLLAKEVFDNHIVNFQNICEDFGNTSETIDLYIYDYIAYLIATDSEEKEENTEILDIVKYLVSEAKQGETIMKDETTVNGEILGRMIYLSYYYRAPQQLIQMLNTLYDTHEKIALYSFMLNSKEYENEAEKESLTAYLYELYSSFEHQYEDIKALSPKRGKGL